MVQDLLALGVASDVVDTHLQFERLDSQTGGFNDQSGHKFP
jgi:hypothetical protein